MEQISAADLRGFTTCDVSDALLKLGVASGGFLPDLQERSAPVVGTEMPLIGKIWTVQFHDKSETCQQNFTGHYIDQVPLEMKDAHNQSWQTIPLLSAPQHLTCAILGGIMAFRASQRQAAAIIVNGRVRDVGELKSNRCKAPVYSRGLSTVGAGAGSKVGEIGTDCRIEGYGIVRTGDTVVLDENGVVVIPQSVDLAVLKKLMSQLTSQDFNVLESVEAGMTVEDAFRKWRT